MKILTVYATKYGSTETVAQWINDRFLIGGHDARCMNVVENPECGGFDVVILGSGIYSHKFLSEMEQYIASNIDALMLSKTALFGVAMRTETFFRRGNAYGGTVMLERYGAMLGQRCVAGRILGGEMVFERLTDTDKHRLEKFYQSIALSEAEQATKRHPRTLLNKRQCWDFAEEIVDCLKS
ncbi:MAG: flavodoxin domain-containing protein [Deferribacterales bacterium]